VRTNVLRFNPEGLSERSEQNNAAHAEESPTVAKGFHTPLPTIDPSFANDDEPSFRRKEGRSSSADTPIDPTAALESMPHLLHKIQALWNSRDLNTFISHLLMDSRDGSRAGFPFSVARELMFLAKTNLIVRAQEAAPMLGVRLGDAMDLISRGDQMALGHSSSADDVWAHHVAHTANPAAHQQTRATVNDIFALKHERPAQATPLRQPSIKLTPFINEHPPLPQSVRLDISTPTALRSARGGFESGGIMDNGLFRCLVKELSNHHISELVLSSLGDSAQCNWLPAGIRFARTNCRFNKLTLQVDLLSAPEDLLQQCIREGTDHLVIYLNQASGKWRMQAQNISATDPDYFRREIARLIAFRDQQQLATGLRCEISVARTSHRAGHAMTAQFKDVDHLPGLVTYNEVVLPPGIKEQDAVARGQCHCLSPFIEAHVRTNGHLVACALDHSGYSFTADLTHTTFTDAWKSQPFRMVRQRVARGEKAGRLCEICPHQSLAGKA
jgi:hypothetical protein